MAPLRTDSVAERDIRQRGMRLMIAAVVGASACVGSFHLLSLKFALDPFAVRSVANEGKDRTNAFDELLRRSTVRNTL
jgi:hypothetical protein